MLDPQRFRQDIDQLVVQLRNRGYELNVDLYQELEDKRKSLQAETENLQAQRNAVSRKIGACLLYTSPSPRDA